VDGSGVVVMVLVVKDRDGGDGGESGSGEWQIPTNGMDSPPTSAMRSDAPTSKA